MPCVLHVEQQLTSILSNKQAIQGDYVICFTISGQIATPVNNEPVVQNGLFFFHEMIYLASQ